MVSQEKYHSLWVFLFGIQGTRWHNPAMIPRKLLIVLREHRFWCREMWAAPEHLIVTGGSLESVLSNRCVNMQDPQEPRNKKQRSQLRVCHKNNVVHADIYRPHQLRANSFAVLVKVITNPQKGKAGAPKSLSALYYPFNKYLPVSLGE